MSFFSDHLKALDAEWQNTEAAESTGSTLPDGRYQAIIEKAQLLESKNEGRPYLGLYLTVNGGPQAGGHAFVNHFFEKDRLPYLKKDLKTLGFELDSLASLEKELPNMLGLVVDITVKTNVSQKDGKSYTNTYINRLAGATSSGQKVAAGAENSRVPF